MDRFEDSLAWQKARALNKAVYSATRADPLSKDRDFVSQIRRASISAMNNIAEGFDRSRLTEFHQFLSIAKGSVAEVRSMLYAALDVGYLDQTHFDALMSLSLETTRLLAGLRSSVARRLAEQDKNALREDASEYDMPPSTDQPEDAD